MFGANAVSRDYTFTQTEDRFKSQISQAISKYVGNVGVSNDDKNKKIASDYDNVKTKDPKETENKAKTEPLKADKPSEELEELQFNVEDLFEDDENDNNIGLLSGGTSASITTSFDALAAKLGATGDKVTKTQLFAFLQSLASKNPSEHAKEIAFVKNLIAKFDTISDGEDYITSYSKMNEPQDYETITQDQVTPPIDIRI